MLEGCRCQTSFHGISITLLRNVWTSTCYFQACRTLLRGKCIFLSVSSERVYLKSYCILTFHTCKACFDCFAVWTVGLNLVFRNVYHSPIVSDILWVVFNGILRFMMLLWLAVICNHWIFVGMYIVSCDSILAGWISLYVISRLAKTHMCLFLSISVPDFVKRETFRFQFSIVLPQTDFK